MNSLYKHVLIYYFSGTGNARAAAYWIGKLAINRGIQTEIRDIADFRGKIVPEPHEYSLVGFCSPTHGFHFPEITRKFIRRFPGCKRSDIFIINTRAGLRIGKVFLPGLSGLAHYVSIFWLRLKGYKVAGIRPVDLPSNWISIHPAVRKRGVDLMYDRQKRKVTKFGHKLLDGQKDYRAVFDLIQDILITPIAIGYLLVGRFALAKSFVASHACTDCGLCIKSCPVKAIKRIDKRMFWTYKCESCMQCMNQCPEKAIETAHLFFFGILFIFINFLFEFLYAFLHDQFPDFYRQFLGNGHVRGWLNWFLVIPVLFAAYRIQHWLMRYRLIERTVIYTSLTSYKFWGRFKRRSVNLKDSHAG